jgi:hypothetical protein
MPEGSKNETQSQPPKKFFVREVDASLLGRNSGLSKNARHLHLILRKMADAKTGELRIGTHWWTPAEIDREAEICARTRKKAMRELVTLGLAHWKRERITVTVNERLSGLLRKHSVWGKVHYSVSPIPRPDWVPSTVHTQNPNTGVCSSTDHNMHRRGKPRKQRVPSTVHNENPDKNPSTVQSVHRAPNAPTNTTEEPKDLPPAALPSPLLLGSGTNSPISQGGDSQGSPLTAPPRDRKPKFEYPSQTQEIIASLESDLQTSALFSKPRPVPVQDLENARKMFLEKTNALAIPFSASIALYEAVVRKFLNAQPKPQPEPAGHSKAEDDPLIDSYQCRNLRRHAKEHGWTKAELQSYLFTQFSVATPMHLTLTEYNRAHARTQHPPSRTN